MIGSILIDEIKFVCTGMDMQRLCPIDCARSTNTDLAISTCL